MKAMKDYRELLKGESLSFEARDFKAGNQKTGIIFEQTRTAC